MSALDNEADLQAFITREIENSPLAVLIRGLQDSNFIAISPITLASPGNGNVSWTTLTLATVPSTARAVVLNASVGGVVPGASYLQNSLDFRADANSQVIGTVAWKAAAAGGGITNQVIVPISDGTIQYQKTDGINNSSGGSVVAVGYLAR